MKEGDYIESYIRKYYLDNGNLEKDKVDEYLKSKNLHLDGKTLEKRILKFKDKNESHIQKD